MTTHQTRSEVELETVEAESEPKPRADGEE